MKLISFRLGMLLGVALILALLGGVAVQGWLLVERLVEESRDANEHALLVTAAIQELGERSVDVERSARQYLVLGRADLKGRFDTQLADALLVVERLEQSGAKPLQGLLAGWRRVAGGLAEGVADHAGQADIAPLLSRLAELNGLLRQSGRDWVDARNRQMLDELEARRLQFGLRIAAAFGGALAIALAMGWWLVRPVRHLEQAIVRLGAGRFAEPVVVGGPADLRQLGRRLDWLRQRLMDLESNRGRTLRHVSHELKTPLTALKEGVALLTEEVPGPLAERQREVVDILRHNVGSLQAQIESLLTLNGAAFEAQRLDIAAVDPKKLLNSAVQRRELHSRARQLTVIVEAPHETARLDGGKMEIILDNLLSNAIDFSPEGSTVRLSASHADGLWRFDCIDEGPGVAEADHQKIFDPFVQGQRSAPAPRQGSGVGLSIVRELVRAMGGTVHLVPQEKGAHFRVEIPDEL